MSYSVTGEEHSKEGEIHSSSTVGKEDTSNLPRACPSEAASTETGESFGGWVGDSVSFLQVS